MNDETKIKLQAYLDGELSPGNAAEISRLLNEDAEAKAYFTELQFVRSALRENEPQILLPESREFYWGKIQREIEQGVDPTSEFSLFSWWKPVYARFAGGVAAACALLMVSFIAFNNGKHAQYAAGEVEGTGEEMGVITFRSDTERMTVVYLFDREKDGLVDSTTK